MAVCLRGILILLCQLVFTVIIEGSLDQDDFMRISEIRVLTNNLPLETKCNHYETAIREMIANGKEESRSAVFAKAIGFLEQKELPFNNPSAVLAELKECQGLQVGRNDTNSGVVIERLKRELEATRLELTRLKNSFEDEKRTGAANRRVSDERLAVCQDRYEMESNAFRKLQRVHLELEQKYNTEVVQLRSRIKEKIGALQREFNSA